MLHTIKAVQKLFAELDAQTHAFKRYSGIDCISLCNKCCLKENLEASVLEFLPLAYNIFTNNKVEETLELLNSDLHFCVFLNHMNVHGNTLKGCSNYSNRGLICRLFGFSATTNKHNAITLYTCKEIKATYSERITNLLPNLQDSNIPMLRYWYGMFSAIDPSMADEYHHINKSIIIALSKVCYYFENKPKKLKKVKAG